jgi:hypothetical protein
MTPTPQRKSIAEEAQKLETPGLIRQVETHLIFGPLSRHFPLAYLLVALVVGAMIIPFFRLHQPIGKYIGDVAGKLILLFIPILMLRMTLRQQAIICFVAVKVTLGVFALAMLTIGVPASLQRHESDVLPNLFIGLIWLPSVEFIPRVTPHQKYVTVARLLLTIPCVYFGIRGGWHWG